MNENSITSSAIEAAIKIHRSLGPGLLESVYQVVLAHELKERGMSVETQKVIPLIYDNLTIPESFRADLIVEGSVIIELKSVEELQPVHFKQLLTYLKLSGAKVGLLINFNSTLLKNGLHRVVNGFEK